MKENKIYKSLYMIGLPAIGFLFLLWYIKNGSCDVVYSDYIRLVNSYLPDVWDVKKLLTFDVLTRIPISYLERIINIECFDFSLTFDRILGIFGLFLSALIIGKYAWYEKLSILWLALCCILMFSLNKWEMILNGSGWAHFIAFALFFWHYLLLDRIARGNGTIYERRMMCLLPGIAILFFAGPYCAVYTAVILLSYGYLWISRNIHVDKKNLSVWVVWILVPFFLYLFSDHMAVYEHAGAYDIGLLEAIRTEFLFFPKFLLNGLASSVIGGEELAQLIADGWSKKVVYLLGALVAGGYLSAICLYLRLHLYKESLFPVILLISGGANHVIVLLGRYVFLNPEYAWSSRYALQYEVGILGIILIFALAVRNISRNKKKKALWKGIVIFYLIVFLGGNCYTTYKELQKMPYREQNYEKMAEIALNYKCVDDKTLSQTFEYSKGADQIRSALSILEENHWNVFR